MPSKTSSTVFDWRAQQPLSSSPKIVILYGETKNTAHTITEFTLKCLFLLHTLFLGDTISSTLYGDMRHEMAIWSPKIHHGARVKYVGIVEAIEADIKNRLLKPGDRLPAQRQIAQTLNVDLTTVTRAINEAARRGLVETQPGSGCFVAQTTFAHYNSMYLTEGKPLDLSMNNPPSPPNIRLEQDIANTLLKLSERTQSSLSHLYYQETAGHPADREAGAQWLKSRIAEASADAVLISSGAHSAIFSILSHLQRCGATAIAAPELCYPGLRSIADYLGLDVYRMLSQHINLKQLCVATAKVPTTQQAYPQKKELSGNKRSLLISRF